MRHNLTLANKNGFHDSRSIAEAFNSYFLSIGKAFDERIRTSG